MSGALINFRGDLTWIHNWEGHKGHPYFPGKKSGLTFDPGSDLAQMGFDRFIALYKPLIPIALRDELREASTIKGPAVQIWLADHPRISAIRIPRDFATVIFPVVAKPYWLRICKRFPVLLDAKTLASVQTVLLSLAYNRGENNPELEVLRKPLDTRDWFLTATIIGEMQQDDELVGLQRRRRAEKKLIMDELMKILGPAMERLAEVSFGQY